MNRSRHRPPLKSSKDPTIGQSRSSQRELTRECSKDRLPHRPHSATCEEYVAVQHPIQWVLQFPLHQTRSCKTASLTSRLLTESFHRYLTGNYFQPLRTRSGKRNSITNSITNSRLKTAGLHQRLRWTTSNPSVGNGHFWIECPASRARPAGCYTRKLS